MADLWVFVAAQIAETKDHFRVLLALDKSIRRDTGTTPDGNEVLAKWAGGMSVTNTSKAVSFFAKAGLLTVEIGFAADENGKLRKSRTIRLAMPDPFPERVSIDLPHRRLNRNQVGVRGQLEEAKSSWPRVPDDGTRGQISDVDSSATKKDTGANGYARAKATDAEPGGDPGSAASEVADHILHAEHDETARRLSGRAFVESPSIDVTESEV